MSKLQELHDLLRDQSKWPLGFEWDYANNSKCALGLAVETGLLRRDEVYSPAAIGLDSATWERIFQRPMGGRFNEDAYTKVKPTTVALRIKRHLKAEAVL